MYLLRETEPVVYLIMFISMTAAYPPRRNKVYCYLAILPFTAAGVALIRLQELLPFSGMISYLSIIVLTGSLFGALLLSGRFTERLILTLMFICTFELSNGITVYLEKLIFNSATFYWRLLNIPFMILGAFAAYRFALHPRRGLPWFCWAPIILTALLTLAQQNLYLYHTFITNLESEIWLRSNAEGSLLRLLILYLSFFACSRITRYYETNMQMAVNQKMIDSQGQLVQESMRLNRELRRQRHEYNHTLMAAQALLQSGEYSRAADLLRGQTETGPQSEDSIHSGNPVADVVLNQKAAEARRLRIPFEADVCLSPDLPLSSAELVTLLANLLDNAIEASKTVDDPKISVHIYPTRCYLCFSVKNRADCSLLDGGDLHTTKANREAHGFGLNLIREIAGAHQGVARFTPGTDGIFSADVTVFLDDVSSRSGKQVTRAGQVNPLK